MNQSIDYLQQWKNQNLFSFSYFQFLFSSKSFNSTPLSHQCNLPSPDRVYNYIVLNIQLLLPKRDNDDVFPVRGRKTLPRRLSPVIDEADMVTLSEKNFSDFVAKNRRVMVVFAAPEWIVAPEHATLSMKLTGASVVAKVDFSQEKKLAGKYKLVRYPSIYFFPGGADLADKYYSEIILEGRTEGKISGIFLGRSDEDDEEPAVAEPEDLEDKHEAKVENMMQGTVLETNYSWVHGYLRVYNIIPPQDVVNPVIELNPEETYYRHEVPV